MAEARQVAALCWRRRKGVPEVLLITSRETRRWVVPKGWPMRGLKDWNAAKREAFEEAGVEGRVVRKPIGTFHYVKREEGDAFPVRVVVYALEVKREKKNWPERSERKRVWFDVEGAAIRVLEPELKAIIRFLEV
jgi:8-oxo-dGTP pyrophosphatase MutT (NUDIX family)